MWNMNNGYHGFSMSKRAVEAYKDGERPLSQWTKEDIIEEVEGYGKFTEEVLRKYPKAVLIDYFLEYSSWHHTGKYCKETSFYSIRTEHAEDGSIDDLNELRLELVNKRKKERKEKLKAQKARVRYLEWVGSRAHPRTKDIDAYAVIIGKWAYLEDGRKKSVDSNGFHLCEEYNRAPNGTAEVFKEIMEHLPLSVRKKIKGEK